MHRRNRIDVAPPRLATLVAGAIVLAGCGAGESAANEVALAAPDETSAAPTTSAPTTTTTGTATGGDQACADELAVLAVVARIFEIDYGRPPEAVWEALESTGSDWTPELWDLSTGEFVATDARCAGLPTDATGLDRYVAAMSPEIMLNLIAADDVTGYGGTECVAELATIAVAVYQWMWDHGSFPEPLTAVIDDGYLPPLELWTLTPLVPEPAAGSPCTLDSADTALRCDTDLRTLQTAVEAYIAMYGDHPTTQADLVDNGLIREALPDFDVVDGTVVPSAGSACGAPATIGRGIPCTHELIELSSMLLLHTARTGNATPSERDLLAGGDLDRPLQVWSLDLGTITAAEPVCEGIATDEASVDELLAGVAPEPFLQYLVDGLMGRPTSIADFFGSPACAREHAEFNVAFYQWLRDHHAPPMPLTDLVDEGYLTAPLLWNLSERSLVAAPGSGCVSRLYVEADTPGLTAEPEADLASCQQAWATLQTALDHYLTDRGTMPTMDELVAAGYLTEPIAEYEFGPEGVWPTAAGDCPPDPFR